MNNNWPILGILAVIFLFAFFYFGNGLIINGNVIIQNPNISFLDLNDTPNTYVGQAGNFVQVNIGENGLQFAASTPGDTNCGGIGSCPNVLYRNTDISVQDINSDDIFANGTISAEDFNQSILDHNDSFSCPAGQAIQTIGNITACIVVGGSGGTGRTYTSGTPATIEVNNDNNTISQNFDGNFSSRFNPAFDTNFNRSFDSNFIRAFDSNFLRSFDSNFTRAFDGNFQRAFDANYYARNALLFPVSDANIQNVGAYKANCDNNTACVFTGRINTGFDSNFGGDMNITDPVNITDTNAFAFLVETDAGADRFRIDTSSGLVYTSTIRPLSDNGQDLGQPTARFRNGYLAGDWNIQGNILFYGTISGGDFNQSIRDHNDSFACAAGDFINSIGATSTCGTPSSSGTGRTYTSGTPGTIQVNNDTNTISQNFDGNFIFRFDSNFNTKFKQAFDGNFQVAFDGNYYPRNALLFPVPDANVANNISVQSSGIIWDSNTILDSRYVNVTGDTVTGTLDVDNALFTVSKGAIVFLSVNGTNGLFQTGDFEGITPGMAIGTRANRYGAISAQTGDFSGDINVMDINAEFDVNAQAFNCKQTDYSNGCLNIAANTSAFSAGAGAVTFDFNNTSKALEYKLASGVQIMQWGFGGASATGLIFTLPSTNANPTFAQQPRKSGILYMYDDTSKVIPRFYSYGAWHNIMDSNLGVPKNGVNDFNLGGDINYTGVVRTDGNFIPDVNNTGSIGSQTNRWQNGYFVTNRAQTAIVGDLIWKDGIGLRMSEPTDDSVCTYTQDGREISCINGNPMTPGITASSFQLKSGGPRPPCTPLNEGMTWLTRATPQTPTLIETCVGTALGNYLWGTTSINTGIGFMVEDWTKYLQKMVTGEANN